MTFIIYSYGQIGIRAKLTTGHTKIPPLYYFRGEGRNVLVGLGVRSAACVDRYLEGCSSMPLPLQIR